METTALPTDTPPGSRTLWMLGIVMAMLFLDQMTKTALSAGYPTTFLDFRVLGINVEIESADAVNRWFILGVGKGYVEARVITLLVTVVAGWAAIGMVEELLKPTTGWPKGFIYAIAAGGVAGNLLDRWTLGGVRDVIGVTVTHETEVMLFLNLADVAVITGML